MRENPGIVILVRATEVNPLQARQGKSKRPFVGFFPGGGEHFQGGGGCISPTLPARIRSLAVGLFARCSKSRFSTRVSRTFPLAIAAASRTPVILRLAIHAPQGRKDSAVGRLAAAKKSDIIAAGPVELPA